eukprot:TRINITY_DN9280_c0_g1_i8.p1 TRINITY_DN9280_c0_g1~~TRINITY_DN9280_c0_g1_i8.p1  ORF type:complete len:133 (-),score=1.43 TRINITY_DN9280_c0_g1_i8:230-628(-)
MAAFQFCRNVRMVLLISPPLSVVSDRDCVMIYEYATVSEEDQSASCAFRRRHGRVSKQRIKARDCVTDSYPSMQESSSLDSLGTPSKLSQLTYLLFVPTHAAKRIAFNVQALQVSVGVKNREQSLSCNHVAA